MTGVMKIVFAALMLLETAVASNAQSLVAGKYSGRGDGTSIFMSVSGSSAEISMAGTGCVGGGEGRLTQISDDHWLITMSEYGQCLVDVKHSDGTIDVQYRDGGDCMAYGGQGCYPSGFLTKD